jgi:hypothetical protein
MIVDLIRGAGNVLLIMVVAGGIAYVGDRVGHQVGRRRLTLFGIRPRYTSTIVAIGTGMLIAFSVTMVAILASQQVRTAFFRLGQLNTQITQLKLQQEALEAKVDKGQVVVPVGALMVPFFERIKQGESIDERLSQIDQFYRQSVQFMNSTYTVRGLRRYVPPSNVSQRLKEEFGTPAMTNLTLSSDLLLIVTAPQNLYRDDAITFDVNVVPDSLKIAKGGEIAPLVIPAGARANAALAINELQQYVASLSRSQLHLLPFLADNVQVLQEYPSLADMQKMLSTGKGSYVMTAYAAQDIYPHTGGVPIVVTLTQSK